MPLSNIQIDFAEQQKILQQFDLAFSDTKLDFTQQLHAFWKAKSEVIKKYGRDGTMLVIDSETRVYMEDGSKRSLEIMHYSEVSENCPWYKWRELPVEEFITNVWEPFGIGLMDDLIAYCSDLFVIFEAGKWFLVYPFTAKNYDGIEYPDFMGGRQADPKAKLPKALKDAGWKMPEDLRDFYCVHATFGDLQAVLKNDMTDAIAAASTLETSLAFLEEYREEWEVGYSFFDLVPFYEDGAGNSQNLYKADTVGNSYITVDWDHETKEISEGCMLEEFMDYHFGQPA